MSSEIPTKHKTRLLWTGGSALGTFLGAALALIVFPNAAFGRNLTGQFGWNLVGFALAIGVTLGLSQWLVLRHVLKDRIAKKGLFLHLWIPVTSIGIAVMILPLWRLTDHAIMNNPLVVAPKMFPGMILLGVTQWFLLHELISVKSSWILITIVGSAIGSIIGLVVAFFLANFLAIPLELTWSLVTGGSIGFLQSIVLSLNLPSYYSEEKKGLSGSLHSDRHSPRKPSKKFSTTMVYGFWGGIIVFAPLFFLITISSNPSNVTETFFADLFYYLIFPLLVGIGFLVGALIGFIKGKVRKEKDDKKEIAMKWSLSANLLSFGLLGLVILSYGLYNIKTYYFPSLITTPLSSDFVEENEVKKISDVQYRMGHSVSISDDFAFIGNYFDNLHTGSVHIFQKDKGGNNNWGFVKKNIPSDGEPDDYFGKSIAISGDILVVGALTALDSSLEKPRSIYIFQKNKGGENNWGEVKRIFDPTDQPDSQFGDTLSISGDTLVVGLGYSGGNIGYKGRFIASWKQAGAVYIFKRHHGGNENWGLIKKITAPYDAFEDAFGYSVSISGDTIVVGSIYDDDAGFNSGSAYIYQRNKGGIENWGEVKKITLPNGKSRHTMGDKFGNSVSISEDTLVIGTLLGESVYVFKQDHGGTNNWGLVQKLQHSNKDDYSEQFGHLVNIKKDMILVTNRHRDGFVYIIENDQGHARKWKLWKKLIPTLPILPNYPQPVVSISFVSLSSDNAIIRRHRDAYIFNINN